MKAKSLIYLAVLVTLGVGAFTPSASFAQRYPDRPIKLIIPINTGSAGDVSARVFAAELEKVLDIKIVPTNVPGVAGMLGVETAIRSKNDGYTLLFGMSQGLMWSPHTNPDAVHYDAFKELEPLGYYYANINALPVRSDAPWKTFRELVDYAKKNPGKVAASTSGFGSDNHFFLELIQSIVGIKLTFIPYEGGQALMTSILGGDAALTWAALATVKPHVDSGKARLLLIVKKVPYFPEVPTLRELGYERDVPQPWNAFYAPAGMPEDARKVLIPAIKKAIENSKPKMEKLWADCEYRSPSAQKKLWEEHYKMAYELAVKLGLRKP